MTGHVPGAEQDADGMWEPCCEHCTVLTEEPFASLLKRWPTSQLAVTAAKDVLRMIGEGDGN